MATLTLYRAIGTAELALLTANGWTHFPDMPQGFEFYAYSGPLDDPREWPAQLDDLEYSECTHYGQRQVVASWAAWGNAPDSFFIVWFEVNEESWSKLKNAVGDVSCDVAVINKVIVGNIEICKRYEPVGNWTHPSLSYDGQFDDEGA